MNCGIFRRFATEVCETGYFWEEAIHKKEFLLEEEPVLVLTERREVPLGTPTPYRHFSPMDNPDLFQRFANLDVSNPERALAFANKYGPLGIYQFRLDSVKLLGMQSPIIDLINESVDISQLKPKLYDTWNLWQAAILDMRRCIELWKSVDDTDRPNLRKRIKRRNWKQILANADLGELAGNSAEEFIYYNDDSDVAPIAKPLISHKFNDGWFFENTSPESLVSPALFYIQKTANGYLKRFTEACIIPSADYKQLEFGLIPNCLIGALWLQFALYINRTLESATCPYCGDTFVPARRGHKYCSNTCRNLFNRNLKRIADE